MYFIPVLIIHSPSRRFTFDPKTRMSVFALFVGYTAHSTYNLGCNQIITQRYMSLPGVKEMGQASLLFMVGLVILTAICLYNGVLLFATYHDCDPLTTKVRTYLPLAVAAPPLIHSM